MILCVGEILADMIGSSRNGVISYERKAGGAPFNVACAAKMLGAEVGFVGAVGDDIIGSYLTDFAARRNFAYTSIMKRDDANTTLAFVNIDEHGERSFCFYRKHTADFLPPIPDDSAVARANIVHIGSLMLSEEAGERYALSLAARAKAAGKIVSFDVNYRSDIFRDTESAVRKYKRMIERADVVKFSQEEANIFGSEYIDGLQDALVCVSLGGEGSRWQYRGARATVPSVKVDPIDTTGAGDAFYGGVLCELDGYDKTAWTAQKLNDTFAFANVCGALNTLQKGAIDGLPDRETVFATLAKGRR